MISLATDARLANLRLENSARCALWLRDNGAATIGEIATATGFSRPTVADRLEDLKAKGVVVERLPARSVHRDDGRPALRFEFRGSVGFVAGLQFGRDVDRIVISDMSGNLIVQRAQDNTAITSIQLRLAAVHEQLRAAVLDEGLSIDSWLGAGVSIPGLLDPNGLMIRSALFPEWDGVDVARELTSTFGVPIRIENDIKSACLAESRLGVARDHSDIIYIIGWHEPTAGIMINRALHRGHRNLAGENREAAQDPFFAQHVPNVEALARAVMASDAGDAAALATVRRVADALADYIFGMVVAVDPDLVVLAGPAISAGAALSTAVRSALDERTGAGLGPSVVTSELGDNASVLGVTLVALDQANATLFGVPVEPISRLVGRDVSSAMAG